MTVQCAQCGSFLCRGGKREAAPEGCPMREDFPEFDSLYASGKAKRFLNRASLVEAEGYLRWTRIREVAEFAQRIGARRIGVPHCPDMAAPARRVGMFMSSQDAFYWNNNAWDLFDNSILWLTDRLP